MNDMVTYWVSFATDEAFLGVTIVDMEEDDADIVSVVKKTIEVGANPGDGSVQMQKLHRARSTVDATRTACCRATRPSF